MRTRPIAFSQEMWRAAAEGRKSQTRRVIPRNVMRSPRLEVLLSGKPHYLHACRCPGYCDYACGGYFLDCRAPYYGCVGDRLWVKRGRYGRQEDALGMLGIVGLRVEVVQEITEADAMAEGIEHASPGSFGYRDYSGNVGMPVTAWVSYAGLWDKINAKRGYGWQQNPWWVSAISFEVIKVYRY